MLSVCAITKNESHCVERMIRSVLGLATEIIIADTGSTDETKMIATNLGARVIEIPWTDDFAAARNRSLEYATQPWVLVLDADEELDSDAEDSIRRFLTGVPQGIFLARQHYTTTVGNLNRALPSDHPASERGATGYFLTHDIRLFPNDLRVRFDGPVHETVELSLARAGLPHVRTDLLIHHYGPIYSRDRQHIKAAHYAELARKQTLLQGDDWRPHFQYGAELQSLARHHEAIAAFRNALARCPVHSPIWRQLAISLIEVGETKQALEALREALTLNPSDILLWNALGVCFIHLQSLDHAELCFQTVLRAEPANISAQKLLAAITAERQAS